MEVRNHENAIRDCGVVHRPHVLPHAPLDVALPVVVLVNLPWPVAFNSVIIVEIETIEHASLLLVLVARAGRSNRMIRIVAVVLAARGIPNESGRTNDLRWGSDGHSRTGVGSGEWWSNVHRLGGPLIDLRREGSAVSHLMDAKALKAV